MLRSGIYKGDFAVVDIHFSFEARTAHRDTTQGFSVIRDLRLYVVGAISDLNTPRPKLKTLDLVVCLYQSGQNRFGVLSDCRSGHQILEIGDKDRVHDEVCVARRGSVHRTTEFFCSSSACIPSNLRCRASVVLSRCRLARTGLRGGAGRQREPTRPYLQSVVSPRRILRISCPWRVRKSRFSRCVCLASTTSEVRLQHSSPICPLMMSVEFIDECSTSPSIARTNDWDASR